MRTRRVPTRPVGPCFGTLTRSLLALLFAAACILFGRRIVNPPAVDAKVVAIPFMLTGEASSPPESKRVSKWSVARRSDGSTVYISYGPAWLGRETSRTIRYIDGSSVVVTEWLGFNSTRPLSLGDRWDEFRKSVLYPPANCVRYDGETLKGFGEIAGERVAIVVSRPRQSLWDAANTMRTTDYRAVELACENLEYTIEEQSHVDGSRKIMTKGRLVSLTLGEPDPSLFEIPPSPTEVLEWEFYKYLHPHSPGTK